MGSSRGTTPGLSASDATVGDGDTPASAEAHPGATKIGRFIVLRRLGAGGMGVVYAVYDEQLDRRVAVKKLLRDVGETARARVAREARAMAKLTHPNVVQVYEVGEDRGQLYIAMEFVNGGTLAQWQAERSWPEIVDAYRQAGEGLAAAHAAGLVHRDFKPQNAIVRESAPGKVEVKVLDFGLAREHVTVELEDTSVDRVVDRARADPKLTAEGSLTGTPAYMAPEQFSSPDVNEAADQFSFCVALWEALFGERPFAGHSASELLLSVTRGPRPEPPRSSAVPRRIADAVLRGLSVSPRDRWPSMRHLLAALAPEPDRRRARIRSGLAVVAAAGVVAAVAGVWWPDPAERCSGGRAQLAGAWGDAARESVRTAMLGASLPYAARAWENAETALDAYAGAWSEMHHEACAATTLRGEQSTEIMDRRMACLHRARVQLQAAVQTLATGDPEVIEHGHEIIGRLPDLDRCADITALQADVAPPPEAEADAVEAARGWLALAGAEEVAGRYEVAKKHVEQAEQALGAATYEPAVIELALQRGSVSEMRGEYEAARDTYLEALALAKTSPGRPALQELASRLLAVIGNRLGKPDEGMKYAMLALELATDARAEATARSALAGVLLKQGKYEEGEAEERRALALWEGLLGPDHPLVAGCHGSIAAARYRQGKYADAEAELRTALAIYEQVFGPDHPKVATVRSSLAEALRGRGELGAAEEESRRALALLQRALGPDHPKVADAHNNLAGVLHARGAYGHAEKELRRALEAFEGALGGEHAKVGQTRNNLAMILYAQGKYAEAEAEHRRALALRERSLGADHPQVANSHDNLGAALQAQGNYAEAEAEHRRALALKLDALGEDHPDIAASRSRLAAVLRDQGRLAEAEEEERQALVSRLQELGDDHPHVASSQTHLARILLDQGRPHEALALAELAWTRAQRDDIPPSQQASAAFALARALWETGGDPASRERALRLAEQAQEGYRGEGEGRDREAAIAEAWLAAHRAAVR